MGEGREVEPNDPRMYRGRKGPECAVCGAPWLRKDGLHAEWCAGVAASLRRRRRAESRPRPEHGTVARYVWGCNCLACHRAWIEHHQRR